MAQKRAYYIKIITLNSRVNETKRIREEKEKAKLKYKKQQKLVVGDQREEKENDDAARYKPWLKMWSKKTLSHAMASMILIQPSCCAPSIVPKTRASQKHLLFPMISLFSGDLENC